MLNTGGSGQTWKDYVHPRGDNAARLYHGLIWIPGASINGTLQPVGTELVRLSSVVGNSYTILPGNYPDSEVTSAWGMKMTSTPITDTAIIIGAPAVIRISG